MDATTETVVETPAETPKPEPKTFGERLRALRDEKGLSRKKLGESLGCADVTILQWETGAKNPKGVWVQRLAWFFNVTDFYLKNGGPRVNTSSTSLAQKQTTALTNKAFRKDEAIANAVDIASDDKMLRGLKRLNLTQEQIDLAMASKEFKRDNMLDTVIAIGGMMDRQLIFLLSTEMRILNEKINDPATLPADRHTFISERSRLHFDIANFIRLNQSGLLMSARVQQIWAEMGEKKKAKKPKAVFDVNG